MSCPSVSQTRDMSLSRDHALETCHVTECDIVTLSQCRIRPLSRSVTEICNEILWETLDWCDNNFQWWETEPGSQGQDIASGD